jgi:hypothetical protein
MCGQMDKSRLLSLPVVFILTASLASAAPQAPLKLLLRKDVNAKPPVETQGRGVRRVERVELSPALFKAKGPFRAAMDLFPGVELLIQWTGAEPVHLPEGLMWKGSVEGEPESRATLLVSGKTVTANINRTNGFIYEIRTTADGRYWVREVSQKDLPREGEPLHPAQTK